MEHTTDFANDTPITSELAPTVQNEASANEVNADVEVTSVDNSDPGLKRKRDSASDELDLILMEEVLKIEPFMALPLNGQKCESWAAVAYAVNKRIKKSIKHGTAEKVNDDYCQARVSALCQKETDRQILEQGISDACGPVSTLTPLQEEIAMMLSVFMDQQQANDANISDDEHVVSTEDSERFQLVKAEIGHLAEERKELLRVVRLFEDKAESNEKTIKQHEKRIKQLEGEVTQLRTLVEQLLRNK